MVQPPSYSEVVVIGAGLSGLAVAKVLTDRAIPVRILDAASGPADSWRRRHPQLRLNTHRRFSHLPGQPALKTDGPFLRRDSVVRYLTEYAEGLPIGIEHDTRVVSIRRRNGRLVLETNRAAVTCSHVVFATGRDRVPFIPRWPGRDRFAGTVIHSADLGDVARFDGKRVLVVGAGNSGSDVLNHLARHQPAKVWVSVRYGPTIVPARILGIPTQLAAGLLDAIPIWLADAVLRTTQHLSFGDLKKHGLGRHPAGGGTRLLREGVAMAIDDGFVKAIKSGRFAVVRSVRALTDDRVVLDDDSSVRPDVVICATGYRPGLEPLLGNLGVLGDRGVPKIGPGDPWHNAPSLWFIGYQPIFSGYFRSAARSARLVADAIEKDLR